MLTLLVFVISMICTVVPVLGNLLSPFVSAVLSGGALLAARNVQSTGTLQVADLFAIFPHPALKSVLIVAGIYVGLILVAAMVFAGITIGVGGMGGGDTMPAGAGAISTLAAPCSPRTLCWMELFGEKVTVVVVTQDADEAPVLFQGAEPWSAMKQSLSACLANLVSMLVYGVLGLIAFSVAMIPFMLGLLIVVPVLFASWLLSYQDIFGVEPPITPTA